MREVFCGRGVAAETKEVILCGADFASRCYFGFFKRAVFLSVFLFPEAT